MIYADLILPLPLPGIFTYLVPEELKEGVMPGRLVMVPFGKKKIYPAIVKSVHKKRPEGYETREILSVPDTGPLVSEVQLRFWEWMTAYYMCTPGEVMKAALPGLLRAGGQTGASSDTANPGRSRLAGYKPRTETFLCLHPSVSTGEKLNEVLEKLKKAPVQLELLTSYLQITGTAGFSPPFPEIPKSRLTAGSKSARSPLKALIDKKILTPSLHEISRLPGSGGEKKEISSLNLYQSAAIDSIREQFTEKDVVLLNGITSAGKTEIYIHLISEEIRKGRQVLYLLPEIALTAQIITRLKNIFGDKAGVYHSKFSDPERVEIWNRVAGNGENGYSLILGVRSSLFLPFREIGLIIVDEEHENTFKQFDPAPRYHARDAAVMLASMHGAKTLLGTATPSVESMYNALSGKYGLVNLTKRYLDIELPEIIIADTREARKKKKMKSLFTPQLLDAMEEALERGGQVILFQNRRGYAPFIECADCGWIPHCDHCDVSMTYHKGFKQLVCHYCGASRQPDVSCPDCGGNGLQTRGFGTEKIEDEVSIFFPGARVARLDLDAARKKRAHERIISDFEAGRTDILAGTQMIAKGLDFGRVSLVGILNADNLLFFPDFRAHERSFQLMAQVSGRAGRKGKRGRVVIQTGFPGHQVIRNLIANDFEKNFREQLAERRQFRYPPYVRLIRIILKAGRKKLLEKAASSLADSLRSRFGNRVLGPEYPFVSRVQNRYIMNILMKIEKGASLSGAKKIITGEISRLQSAPGLSSVTVAADVDPV